MLSIEPSFKGKYAFLHTGFRPFFLLAMLSAVVLAGLWVAIYSFGWPLLRPDYPAISWHAHEMLFGYALAVVAGFLLTAVHHWTGLVTAEGRVLLLFALWWLVGRVLPFMAGVPLWYLGLHEALWLLALLYLVVRPVIKRKQWKQMAIMGKLLVLLVASLIFHAGLSGAWQQGTAIGLYLAFYTLIGLILVMGRRVIPAFIENTVGGGWRAHNEVWADRLSLWLFVLFVAAELFAMSSGNHFAVYLSAALALLQCPVHLYRLYGWHHRQIWRHPLLWTLFVAYAWIAAGFFLKFLTLALNINPWASVHAFAYGGLGLITLGMMSRVALGHTGRNVFVPPVTIGIAGGLLAAGAVVRVVRVALWPQQQAFWVLAALLIWMAAFVVLLVTYLPMLVRARVDGRYG